MHKSEQQLSWASHKCGDFQRRTFRYPEVQFSPGEHFGITDPFLLDICPKTIKRCDCIYCLKNLNNISGDQ